MNVHIEKDGRQMGPYSLEELNARLASETIRGDDLCWYEGCEDWMPVSQLPGYVPPPALQRPSPIKTNEPRKRAAAKTRYLHLFWIFAVVMALGLWWRQIILDETEKYKMYSGQKSTSHREAKAPEDGESPALIDERKKQQGVAEIVIVSDDTKQPPKDNHQHEINRQTRDPNIDLVRNGILPIDDTRTLGDIFEKSKLLTNPRWRAFEASTGANVVEFEGDIQDPDKLWTEFKQEFQQKVTKDPVNFFMSAGNGETAVMGIMGMNILSNLPVKLESLSYKVQFLLSKADKGKFRLGIQKCTVRAKSTTTGKTIEETFDDKENAILKAFYEDEVSTIPAMAMAHLQTSQTLKEALLAADHASTSSTQKEEANTVITKTDDLKNKQARSVPNSGYSPPKGDNRVNGIDFQKSENDSDNAATPLGRYKKTVSSAVGSRWNYYIQKRMPLLQTGKVTVVFTLDARGKVRDFRIEENTSNAAHTALIEQCVREAKFDAPPPEALHNGVFEYPMSFHLK